VRQIAYFSTAAEPQTNELIHNILITARINNRRDEITGLLVAGGNRYMQIIEGPRGAVSRLYENIQRDRRHLAVTTLVNRTTYKRAFEGWSMAFRREPALGRFDRFPDVVRYLTEQVEDSLLKNQIRNFSSIFIAPPAADDRTPWPVAS
jgi:hypothetical protein